MIPGGREGIGPTLDSRSGNFVAYGTLSEYRQDDEAIRLQVEAGDAFISARDNFFTVAVNAQSQSVGLRLGTSAFEQFLRLLAVEHGDLFEYELLQIESDDGQVTVRPAPRAFQLARITAYNTGGLAANMMAAAKRCSVDDDRLTKSLLYYEHAQFLYRLREPVGIFSPHFSFLLTSAFLQVWKGIATIVGEPGTDSDYQRRFTQYGLPENYWQDVLRPLADVRNDFDVAHYSLDQSAIERVEVAFGKAQNVCRAVIKAYSDYLLRNEQGVDGSGPTAKPPARTMNAGTKTDRFERD